MLAHTFPSKISTFAPPNGRISLFNLNPIEPPHRKISSFSLKPPTKLKFCLSPNRYRKTLRRVSTTGENGEWVDENPSIVEAREAVSEILQDAGLSREESEEIALNSPKYVKILIDGVHDLDELSLWGSYRSEDDDGESLDYKRKVLYVAKEKGDNGLLPFLESVGSSTHVARYLAGESLPNLVVRVKYLKDMLFPNSDYHEYVGKNARRVMSQLSIPTTEDVQQTLSFFQKMEARRGGLKMLGSKDFSFQYLVESFPRIFLLSVEDHLEPLIKFFEDVGVPKERIGGIFLVFPPTIFYNIEKDLRPRLHIFEKVGAKERDIGMMLLKYPWILSISIQRNYDDILSFFEVEKVPKSNVDDAITSWPHLLGGSTSKMKRMVEEFGNLGVRSKKLGKVIASSPQLLLSKPDEFLKVVDFMAELGLDKESIGRILVRCPEIFAASIENTLIKKVKFLLDIGISKEQFPRVIRKYPEFLVSDIDDALLPRMEYLMKIGFSKRQVASMVRRFSPLLGYSIDTILGPKLDFLVNTMEKSLGDVVDYPRYLSYSLEKKIKPRFWVLKGRNMESSLEDMLGKNDEEFAADFMGIERMLVPPPDLQE